MAAMTTSARVLATLATTAAMLIAGAAPMWADTPSTWADPTGRSTMGTLVFFGGWTIGLYALVVLFALVTSRNNYVPPAPPAAQVEEPSHH
jgi:Ca2+/H+ antiporter